MFQQSAPWGAGYANFIIANNITAPCFSLTKRLFFHHLPGNEVSINKDGAFSMHTL
jgi:hypothetical protein